MTRAQYEREKLKLARERELRRLADARRHVDPKYVISVAGFWLKRQAPFDARPHPHRTLHFSQRDYASA